MSYVDFAIAEARRYGIDPDLFVRQLTQESGFRPTVCSYAGACGIGQFIPETWTNNWRQHPELTARYGNLSGAGHRSNPFASISAAAAHMSDLLRSYGSYRNALIAYNAGPGWVDTPTHQLPDETQTYLNILLGGGGGGGPFSETAAGQEAQYGYDVDILERRGQLDLALEEARARNDRELQLLILRERARIDQAAEERGFQRAVWMDAVRRWHESEENRKMREHQVRQQAIGEISALERSFADTKQQASEIMARTTGVDPLRTAVVAQGGVQRGQTPAQGFRKELSRVTELRSPAEGLNLLEAELPELFGAIRRYGDITRLPTTPRGLAGRALGARSFAPNPEQLSGVA